MPRRSDDRPPPDLLLVGGGLANGLIAYRLRQLRPELEVEILEGAAELGGRHTWSFFNADLTDAQRAWIAPFVAHRWPGYGVKFPAHQRHLTTGYASVTATRFAQVLHEALGDRMSLGTPVAALTPVEARLADGGRRSAAAVIDGRGPGPSPDLVLGFQKFVGVEVDLRAPHGLEAPIIMDATVDQLGGYRFLYVLPLSPDRLLIEDTRYEDGPDLDAEALRDGALAYAAARRWDVSSVVREEEGVLPVALDGDLAAHHARSGAAALSGLRAGLFHPTTGYSLPDAVRLADHVAGLTWTSGEALQQALRDHAMKTWAERGFYRLLNRMLFRAARPEARYRILERFYRLPQPLIERFYAARSSFSDKARILSGKPPVPVAAALGCLIERGRA